VVKQHQVMSYKVHIVGCISQGTMHSCSHAAGGTTSYCTVVKQHQVMSYKVHIVGCISQGTMHSYLSGGVRHQGKGTMHSYLSGGVSTLHAKTSNPA